MKVHYCNLGKYIEVLKRSSAASTFIMETDLNIVKEISMFQNFVVCFDGLKNGFVGGYRPVLCIDLSFLKNFLRRTLLSAVGIDENIQMFSLARAVAEGENNDSWGWFLTNVRACLGGTNGGSLTIISNQHKILTTLFYANSSNYSSRLYYSIRQLY